MPYDHAIYCQQIGLKTLGFDPGPADGLDGRKTRAALSKSEQARFAASGNKVPAGKLKGMPPRPEPNYQSKVRVFGSPGRESALKRVTLPWKMKIAWSGGYRTTLRMHKLVADLMIMALTEILEKHGMEFVRKYGLDLFGGDYVNRNARGSSRSKSDHAWGIALDLNPVANGNHHTWKSGEKASNGTYEMPRAAIKIFQKYGFQVGFKKSNGTRRDMMHIAYVNRF
ncbi:MAG: M15 family metallopeptidase [Akkermansiaceae bacterium]